MTFGTVKLPNLEKFEPTPLPQGESVDIFVKIRVLIDPKVM